MAHGSQKPQFYLVKPTTAKRFNRTFSMASFTTNNYQNPLVFCFLMLIRAIISSVGITKFKKGKTTVVVVVK